MKKLLFFIIFISLTGLTVFAQTLKPAPIKPPAPKTPPAKPAVFEASVTEISSFEWNQIVKTLEAENWEKSSQLTLAALKQLKSENDKKQMSRLRYFYLYSLAGKIAQKTMPATELERISQAFVGQDFLMPSREILADCAEKVNYICAVKSDKTSLRVTATNKTASAINSFEYVKLPEKFDVAGNTGKQAFLGGKLKKVEIGTYQNDLRIVKLYFEEGYADIVKG